ncbi:unnamed protein product [Trichobilharzia regenti]|nr:unnamed protein product [Trichobilharzia regenti]
MKRPMLRKFAFRMALAAHRYSRAKQPHLAIRSYKSAMPIVMGHGWSLLEVSYISVGYYLVCFIPCCIILPSQR